ncbi:PoNi-like cognate immunity protein [Ralstonia solanacearum]|uniref:DUF1911 domain-containing protein n=1 Tax=Ralstonia solanacearum TaxID=305 RepID=A0AAE3T3L4_RALSL|nr:PoNe immunity protein domain-containing protein [Ralstonia solanacearum]MBB6584443.1 DUF1911 domain-containing protein [Ralstonia solanacearum]MDB0521547.1 DUF1911 domain-containing protein [Ralstonia solanacearum]
MIRAPIGNQEYWKRGISFLTDALPKKLELLSKPSVNPVYDPQYVLNLSHYYVDLMLRSYSRGDSIRGLDQYFAGLLDAWELSDRLAVKVCDEYDLKTCRDWDFSLANLNHYNYCFWLVGLALTLEIPGEQWRRLVALVGGAGEDVLLDRVIASRESQRSIGRALLHPKPYARLLKAVNTAPGQQAEALLDFVNHWYPELKRPAPKERQAPRCQPYWYNYGDPEKNPLDMDNYFGRWCIEAVAAVKAFGLDDSLCLGHEHYPGDLLRPDGPSTHKPRPDVDSASGESMLMRLLSKFRKGPHA